MSDKNKIEQSDYINITEIVIKLINKKSTIYKSTLLGFTLGLVIAIFSANEYSSYSTFVPQLSSGLNSSSNPLTTLSSLAGLKRTDLNNDGVEISPLIYPLIIESVPYRLELLESKILYNDQKISVREFLLEKSTFNLIDFFNSYIVGGPKKIVGLLFQKKELETNNKSDIYSITEQDNILFKKLNSLLKLTLNERDRFVTISTTHRNKTIPAQITKNAEIILQSKIIDYKVQYSKEILDYVSKEYNLKLGERNNLQDQIAIFKDRNININSSLYKNKLDRLTSELQILNVVCQQLASQLEDAKLQVNKETPVFTIIEPVTNPFEKSGPNRFIIIMLYTSIFLFLAISYALFESYILKLINTVKVR